MDALVVAGAVVVNVGQAHFVLARHVVDELAEELAAKANKARERHPLKPHVVVLHGQEQRSVGRGNGAGGTMQLERMSETGAGSDAGELTRLNQPKGMQMAMQMM
jgi:hypothetical protein